jgi:hypothetical protein
MELRAAAAALALTLGMADAATAQRVTVTGGVSAAEHRVDAGDSVEVSSGPLVQVGVSVLLRKRWTLGLEAMVGALSAEGSGSDRDVSQLRGRLGFRVASWLLVEAGYGSRMYSAPIANQRWNALSLAMEGSLPFSPSSRLIGTGRIALLPAVTVTGLDGPNAALTASAGVEYRPGALTVGLSYWLERYDFPPAAGVERSEQLAGLMVRATWSP